MSEVVHLFQLNSRECAGCADAHHEPGTLCFACRSQRAPTAPATVAGSVASVIADLEHLEGNRFPLANPILNALKKARELYDAVGPRMQDAPGEIHFIEGEFWAHPADGEAPIGPFGCAELADDALVERAANRGAAGAKAG